MNDERWNARRILAKLEITSRKEPLKFFLSLAGAALSTGLMHALFAGFQLTPGEGNQVVAYLVWCTLRITMIWCSILCCIGFAGRYLRFNCRALEYFNRAVYPLFILHLTTQTVLGYYLVRTDWNIWTKYLLLTTVTIVMILFVYNYLIRPFRFMCLVFGVKPETAAGGNSLVGDLREAHSNRRA